MTDKVDRTQGVSYYFSKYQPTEAIRLSLEDLFLCLGRKGSKNSVEIFTRELQDINPELLVIGLSEAMRTTKDWLTPGMIRELCVGSQADLDAAAADEAWNWVLKFIKDHTATGLAKPGALIFHEGKPPTCEPDTPAPKMPLPIANALGAIGGTPHQGLRRISDCFNTELVFIRRDFAAAYGRARRLG